MRAGSNALTCERRVAGIKIGAEQRAGMQRITGDKKPKGTGIVFDHIFCAEQAKAYKPSPPIYKLPFDRLGLKLEEVLRIAVRYDGSQGRRVAMRLVKSISRFPHRSAIQTGL